MKKYNGNLCTFSAEVAPGRSFGSPGPLKPIKEAYTKAKIIQHLSEAAELTESQVKKLFDEMAVLAKRHLMTRGSGEFAIPDLGLKVIRGTKPATKKRVGRNPATGEPLEIPAKPKRDVIKTTVLKSLKSIFD